ncbi:CPBP family glutamic-type intramembrane protease [Wolbachia sp. wLmal]|uniref:CPBP family glutamic-type intramembrane protease n=1 Tax=Wolbachia sp. wLmal TaxID=3342489 RepID=UPI003C2E220C
MSFAHLLLTSIIYTWLFEKNGSIWSVVIAHSLFYAFPFSLTPIVGVAFFQSVSFSLLLTVFYFFAVLGIVLFGEPNREGTFLKTVHNP